MRLFLLVSVGFSLSKAILYVFVMPNAKYPRKLDDRSLGDDMLSLLSAIAIAAWASWILWR